MKRSHAEVLAEMLEDPDNYGIPEYAEALRASIHSLAKVEAVAGSNPHNPGRLTGILRPPAPKGPPAPRC